MKAFIDTNDDKVTPITTGASVHLTATFIVIFALYNLC